MITRRPLFVLWTLVMLAALINACAEPRVTEQVAPSPTSSPTRAAIVATATTAPSATREPSPLPAASGVPSATTVALPSATARSSPSPTPPPRTVVAPAATASPTSEIGPAAILGPLQLDSVSGRIYTPCRVGGRDSTCVLATQDGALLATWAITGSLALDSSRGLIYADGGSTGVAVVDASSGQVIRRIDLTRPNGTAQEMYPAPQADPATGQVLAFRGNTVYVIDPERGDVAREIPFDVPMEDSCRLSSGPLPIAWTAYDSARRLLYLDFVTYSCIPWIGHTVVSYDMDGRQEIARGGVTSRGSSDVIPWDGRLYGVGWYRMGVGYRWVWEGGRPSSSSSYWTYSTGGLAVDAGRGLLYQGHARRLHVFSLPEMTLAFVAELPVAGQVAGYDELTDNLYLLDEGHLRLWPAARIPRPTPQDLQATTVPTTTLRALVFSPTFDQDHTLFGIWDEAVSLPPCWVFGVQGGPLLLSPNGGESWHRPVGGLLPNCSAVQVVAASPGYARDKTLLANIVGLGLHRSTDGGRLWEPAGAGLGSLDVSQIVFSPDYAGDHTIYLIAGAQDTLYRSVDSARTWTSLGERCGSIAISPEFGMDRTLVGAWYSYPNNQKQTEIRISRDGGETSDRVGNAPVGEFVVLGLAPLYSKWGVAFGHGDDTLYRSSDGGATWQAVLRETGLQPLQIVFAPEMETNRPLFLIADVAKASQDERLYRSPDGGQTWAVVDLGDGIHPRALAIAPRFAEDGTIFVGTSDARVLRLNAEDLD